ncbi:MAG: 16S rRNA (guanine(527)-N(7))-methyltransferase RsmG [Crocinitomicaceae bacterium]|nr:16S rRNA (guanine(527)-N(7))-methyltransferase RsmG [Crocinitomicaceae bacterium]|tara:strand:+ start:10571 stop:11200 length:630 start_codon:yes stop_codon:yes gene_type:complete
MNSIDSLIKYFPKLTEYQIEQFSRLENIYNIWNAKINVISRKDTENFQERHLMHSLAIAKVINFVDKTKIMDVGTGGGFPGIPLSIIFPNCNFFLVDSIGKKIKVVKEVINELDLKNVSATHNRAEKINDKFDFIVSRAVTKMPKFISWTKGKFLKENKNKLENGILYLKGGDLREEMASIKKEVEYFNINKFYSEQFFETKKVVYIKN